MYDEHVLYVHAPHILRSTCSPTPGHSISRWTMLVISQTDRRKRPPPSPRAAWGFGWFQSRHCKSSDSPSSACFVL